MFTNRLRRPFTVVPGLLLVLITAVALTACGGDATPLPAATATTAVISGGTTDAGALTTPTTDPSGGASSGGSAQEVKATLKEWAVEVPSTDLTAGKYKFTVANAGSFSHNMTILDASGKEVAATPSFKTADGTKELDVDLPAGSYTFECTIPGHPAKGMKTAVTVK